MTFATTAANLKPPPSLLSQALRELLSQQQRIQLQQLLWISTAAHSDFYFYWSTRSYCLIRPPLHSTSQVLQQLAESFFRTPVVGCLTCVAQVLVYSWLSP